MKLSPLVATGVIVAFVVPVGADVAELSGLLVIVGTRANGSNFGIAEDATFGVALDAAGASSENGSESSFFLG